MSLVFVVEENTTLLLKMSERTTTVQVVNLAHCPICLPGFSDFVQRNRCPETFST